MKRFVLIFVFSIVAFSYSSAQDKPSVAEDPNGGYLALGYDFMLTDEVDGNWSLSVEYRNKRYFGNAIYAGFGLGLYFPHTNTSIKDYDMQVKTSQTHFLLPVFIGAGNKTGKFTLDTGPYLDWGIAGKTTSGAPVLLLSIPRRPPTSPAAFSGRQCVCIRHPSF